MKNRNEYPAKVAKVGKRTPMEINQAANAGPYMRANLRHLAKWALITIGVMFGTAIAGGLVVAGNAAAFLF